MLKYLWNAPLLLLLSGCSTLQPIKQMPQPPANLAQPCVALPQPPNPLIDPDRAQWEADLLYSYADCAARHLGLSTAWRSATAPRP